MSLISWQLYLQSTQNNLQCSKNLTANALNPISKPANKHFLPYLGNITSNLCKTNLQCYKNSTANALNPISKAANKSFRLYLGNNTSKWRKITSNVLKKERQMSKTQIQSCRRNVFARILATLPPIYVR